MTSPFFTAINAGEEFSLVANVGAGRQVYWSVSSGGKIFVNHLGNTVEFTQDTVVFAGADGDAKATFKADTAGSAAVLLHVRERDMWKEVEAWDFYIIDPNTASASIPIMKLEELYPADNRSAELAVGGRVGNEKAVADPNHAAGTSEPNNPPAEEDGLIALFAELFYTLLDSLSGLHKLAQDLWEAHGRERAESLKAILKTRYELNGFWLALFVLAVITMSGYEVIELFSRWSRLEPAEPQAVVASDANHDLNQRSDATPATVFEVSALQEQEAETPQTSDPGFDQKAWLAENRSSPADPYEGVGEEVPVSEQVLPMSVPEKEPKAVIEAGSKARPVTVPETESHRAGFYTPPERTQSASQKTKPETKQAPNDDGCDVYFTDGNGVRVCITEE
ncbi:MAG: hypothetical protein ACD_76C00152G0003 [uncultured bacterium]|nr:MAG: hypothetical protein ACD_76C00152G0003 [uncultured bacterium]